MKNIALITNWHITEKLNAASRVAEKIGGRAESILIPDVYKDRIMRARMHRSEYSYIPVDDIYSKAELIIVIGGDGSMLDAARRAARRKIPVLGINMGRIGYMT